MMGVVLQLQVWLGEEFRLLTLLRRRPAALASPLALLIMLAS